MMKRGKRTPGKRSIGNLLHGLRLAKSLSVDSLRSRFLIGTRDFMVHHSRVIV